MNKFIVVHDNGAGVTMTTEVYAIDMVPERESRQLSFKVKGKTISWFVDSMVRDVYVSNEKFSKLNLNIGHKSTFQLKAEATAKREAEELPEEW